MSQCAVTPQRTDWPTSTQELDVSERLIIWALRRWVHGLRQNDGRQWTLVWKEFGRQFNGRDGTIALAGFVQFVDALQRHTRRAMQLHRVCCSYLSTDEIRLIGIVAACQGEAAIVAKARAEWLVHAEGIGDILEAGAKLATIMQRNGLTLPRRKKGHLHEDVGVDTELMPATLH